MCLCLCLSCFFTLLKLISVAMDAVDAINVNSKQLQWHLAHIHIHFMCIHWNIECIIQYREGMWMILYEEWYHSYHYEVVLSFHAFQYEIQPNTASFKHLSSILYHSNSFLLSIELILILRSSIQKSLWYNSIFIDFMMWLMRFHMMIETIIAEIIMTISRIII